MAKKRKTQSTSVSMLDPSSLKTFFNTPGGPSVDGRYRHGRRGCSGCGVARFEQRREGNGKSCNGESPGSGFGRYIERDERKALKVVLRDTLPRLIAAQGPPC
jgi:hypothetical protein